MTNHADQLAALISTRARARDIIRGTLGDGQGNVVDPTLADTVYVRLRDSNSSLVSARNIQVPALNGVFVDVERTYEHSKTFYTIIGLTQGVNAPANSIPYANTVLHGATHAPQGYDPVAGVLAQMVFPMHNYIVAPSDVYIGVSGALTARRFITLPLTRDVDGQVFIIKDDTGASGNTPGIDIEILTSNSELIDNGSSIYNIALNYGALTIVADATNSEWHVIAGEASIIIPPSPPINAQYLTLALDATLTNERQFVAGAGLLGTDLGAGSTFTVDIVTADTSLTINANSMQVRLATNSGLQISSGLQLGTPSSVTSTSTNAVSAATHSHAIDSTIVPGTRTVTAGVGLTGGGALSANITISMGTPSTDTVATTNSASGTTHTHAITSSSNPGAAASILASDASGQLTLVNLLANTTTFNLVNTTATTVNLAGAATTITIGATTGTMNLRNATVNITGGLNVGTGTGAGTGQIVLDGNTSWAISAPGNNYTKGGVLLGTDVGEKTKISIFCIPGTDIGARQEGIYVNVSPTVTQTGGDVLGMYIFCNPTYTGAGSNISGLYLQAAKAGAGTVSNVNGIQFVSTNSGTGNITNLFGANLTVSSSAASSISDMRGIVVDNAIGAGTANNYAAFYVKAPNIYGTGAYTNFYGLYVESISGAGTRNYSIYTNDGTVGFGSDKFNINSSGLVTKQNNVVTEGMGVATVIDDVALTAQVADITATNISSASVAGRYRVNYYIEATATNALAGAVIVTFAFTDAAGATTVASVPLALTALGRTSGVFFVQLASGNITYAVTHTGIFSTSAYALFIIGERLA